jgi:hypothetical protein
MSTKWRRFEVMLPRQFNDGRDVPPEWLSLAALEIGDHFGSVSYETQIIEGRWQHSGVVYRDNLARIVVDMPDKKENRTWMKGFKKRWKEKLEQVEIWMISYRIDIE